ncbi:hypothetical protein GMMP15_730064 [Candidatus Magnetomoraceae bacterium gMMP-15]
MNSEKADLSDEYNALSQTYVLLADNHAGLSNTHSELLDDYDRLNTEIENLTELINIFDVNNDRVLGIPEAIHALQGASGIITQ